MLFHHLRALIKLRSKVRKQKKIISNQLLRSKYPKCEVLFVAEVVQPGDRLEYNTALSPSLSLDQGVSEA